MDSALLRLEAGPIQKMGACLEAIPNEWRLELIRARHLRVVALSTFPCTEHCFNKYVAQAAHKEMCRRSQKTCGTQSLRT